MILNWIKNVLTAGLHRHSPPRPLSPRSWTAGGDGDTAVADPVWMVDRRSKDNSHLIVGLRASYYRIRNVIMSRPHEAKTRQVVSELRATARARAHTHTHTVCPTCTKIFRFILDESSTENVCDCFRLTTTNTLTIMSLVQSFNKTQNWLADYLDTIYKAAEKLRWSWSTAEDGKYVQCHCKQLIDNILHIYNGNRLF